MSKYSDGSEEKRGKGKRKRRERGKGASYLYFPAKRCADVSGTGGAPVDRPPSPLGAFSGASEGQQNGAESDRLSTHRAHKRTNGASSAPLLLLPTRLLGERWTHLYYCLATRPAIIPSQRNLPTTLSTLTRSDNHPRLFFSPLLSHTRRLLHDEKEKGCCVCLCDGVRVNHYPITHVNLTPCAMRNVGRLTFKGTFFLLSLSVHPAIAGW